MGTNHELIGLLTAADINEAYGLMAAKPQTSAVAGA